MAISLSVSKYCGSPKWDMIYTLENTAYGSQPLKYWKTYEKVGMDAEGQSITKSEMLVQRHMDVFLRKLKTSDENSEKM